MNYLGLDWGERKIGIALGSDEVKVASPILDLCYSDLDEALKEIKKIIDEENIKTIVLGQPLKMSGSKDFSREFEIFRKKIKDLGPEVILEDERLSSKMAQGLAREREDYKKISDDALAAVVILQAYLDNLP
ncbi:MAG TPA: Holliday junction resolvase RuvX [Patescibacteria group bacterium]|nr:Holliday junction resolvase RuvX [Patescibacteria group bacterium]